MDAGHEQPEPPGADREQDAHFLNRVDTALDKHRKNSEPPPLIVHETVIHTQAPTPDAISGVGPPATAPAGEVKHDTLSKPPGSAAAPQFFGAGGPMCVMLFIMQIVSDLSVPNCTHPGCVDSTSQRCKVARRPGLPVLHPQSWVLEIRVRGLDPRRSSLLARRAVTSPVRTVARPDYTEEKIVLAMVSFVAPRCSDSVPIDRPFHSRSACQRGERAISVINSHVISRQADRRFLRVSTYIPKHRQWLEYDVKVSSRL